MTLLDFARGPAMQWSLVIFTVGVLWRLVGTLAVMRRKDLSTPRRTDFMWGGLRTILTRFVPERDLSKRVRFQLYATYVWHIGLFITLFLFAPHIEFFSSILGFGWPALPNGIIHLTAAITLATLVALLVRRLVHPVLRMISGADDYIGWLITTLPVVTGLLAYAHLGARYETMLALHILSVELLMVYFPFGKLMHAFTMWPSLYKVGVTFERRGVEA